VDEDSEKERAHDVVLEVHLLMYSEVVLRYQRNFFDPSPRMSWMKKDK
jgi:hypothetical protein